MISLPRFFDFSASGKKHMDVLMHIPKTAGSTIASGLIDILGHEHVVHKAWFDELVRHSRVYGLENCGVIVSHISWREICFLKDKYNVRVSTLLRDPVERVLSNYRFWRMVTTNDTIRCPTSNAKPLIDTNLHWKDDLDRILRESDHIWKYRELSNLAMWQIATAMHERTDRSNNTALKQAKINLKKMAFVGFHDTIAEDFEHYTQLVLNRRIELPQLRINSTEKWSEIALDADVRDLISRHNAYDIDLYHWATSHFRR
jgi:hypothetical protein